MQTRQKNWKRILVTEKQKKDTASRRCENFNMETEDKNADLRGFQSFLDMSRKSVTK